ncbi:MAG: endonuclease III [Deltaproteobacteria bacterium]|nr:endonuclease III [Deltaproteobacteria bacterium]MBW2180506.1 endonuclease III [Deltaproteobacteria bacterium]MBW2365684.1 endonuclease III [Deltaproteobacteria bacterium]
MANKGASPFEVLITTILSLRTKDDVTAKAAKKLLAVANTPDRMVTLSEKEIETLIYPAGFYPTKAKRIKQISKIIIDTYKGITPDDLDELLKLPGVGRKTANLVLIEGFKKNAICVDTHVHRISNRVGLVTTKTPDKTEFALRKSLPEKYWIQYNEILVAFGQIICRPVSPICSRCPVEHMCPRINVLKSR